MSLIAAGLGPPRTRSRVIAVISGAALIAVLVAALFGPSVSMALTGDSYQWIQHAHAAAHDPALLVADLDTFFRPSTTWTLVADRMCWGGFEARGFRTSSLILHGLAALVLAIAGRRLGLSWVAATAVSLVWVTSPFTDESAFVVAYRFEPLLLVSWLAMIAVWPRADEAWSRSRLIAAAATVVAAAAAKETWVVTPVLVAALELNRRRTWRGAILPTVLTGSAVAVYVLVYFAAFPTSKTYFELGPHIVAKIPTQLAAFLYLQAPIVTEISMTRMGLIAFVAVSAMVASCVKWRVPGSLVAGCLFLLPTLPTLLVPYMPQRYLAIPYAGFLLMVALWGDAAIERFERWRSLIRAVSVVLVALVIAAGAAIVRADLEDYERIAAAHAVLLDEAEGVADAVVGGGPVLVVRDERLTPSIEVIQSPVGFPKLAFIRNHDPYGLIDAAALFEWVLADEGTSVEHVADWASDCEGTRGTVLVHRVGGFEDLGTTPNLASDARHWRTEGRGFQVLRCGTLSR